MGRVLKIIAVLFGTFLLLMTIGGLVGRPANGGAHGVLIGQSVNNTRPELYWVVPGTPIDRRLDTGSEATRIYGQSANSRYIYWKGASADEARLWRVDMTTRQIKMISGSAPQNVRFSPDGQWLVSQQEPSVSTGLNSLYRTRLDGSDSVNLTDSSFFDFTEGSTRGTWAEISPDSQWVYFTGIHAGLPQIYRVPMAGGAVERITQTAEETEIQAWPPTSAWPIVRRDYHLYWMRPDGGEFQSVWPTEPAASTTDEQIIGWLPAEQILVVRRDNGPLTGVRRGETQPIWQVDGPYSKFIKLGNWLIFYGSAVARMRPDGSEFSELAGQVGSDSASLIGLGLDEPALVFFRDFPGTANVNYQQVRLSDGDMRPLPVTSAIGANQLLTNLDWNSPYVREVMVNLTITNLQPFRTSAKTLDGDFVAVGPPIDRKWQPFSLILIAGGLMMGVSLRQILSHIRPHTPPIG